MNDLTIGEVARRAGLQPSAIRYYESVGLLPLPKRVNGRRRYGADVFKRLGLIQLVRQAGFGISEMQALFAAFAEDTPAHTVWQVIAAQKEAEMLAVIEQAQATQAWLHAVQQCECEQVGDCVTVTFDANMSVHVALSCSV